jgi:V/A-type H+-transporting ATPase subunit C
MLYKISKNKDLIDILSLKYDFHNLKTAVKAKFLGIDAVGVYSDAGAISVAEIKKYLAEPKRTGDLPDFIYDAADAVLKAFEDHSDPQEIDILLDKKLFEQMLVLCDEIQNDFITEYVRLSIDFYNIKTLLRVKNMQKGTRFLGECLVPGGKADKSYFLENYDKSPDTLAQVFYYKYFGDTVKQGMESYAKTGNFSDLEKLFDNYLIEYVKKSKYIPYGPEVLFAYIVSKENEIRQIRILMTAKINNIGTDVIKERLRDNYA